MPVLRNYYFINFLRTEELAAFGKFHGDVAIIGEVYGKEGFENGRTIITSPIKELNDEKVETRSGTQYTLEEMSRDYRDFLNALERNIPIVQNWRIIKKSRGVYTLYGNCNGRALEKSIVSIDENNIITTLESEKYFVNWLYIDEYFLFSLKLKGVDSGFNLATDFEKFCANKCKPILTFSK